MVQAERTLCFVVWPERTVLLRRHATKVVDVGLPIREDDRCTHHGKHGYDGEGGSLEGWATDVNVEDKGQDGLDAEQGSVCGGATSGLADKGRHSQRRDS